MVRIYTRAGDGGETSLGDGSRVPKSGPRVDLYGEVDELSSLLGCCAAVLCRSEPARTSTLTLTDLAAELEVVQRELFALGTVLADPRLSAAHSQPGHLETEFSAQRLEGLIDQLDQDLPALKNFILPGGHEAAALLHLARAVSRRTERKAVALAAAEPISACALVYLNRLSDYLFTAARWVNAANGKADVPWRPADSKSPPTEGGAT